MRKEKNSILNPLIVAVIIINRYCSTHISLYTQRCLGRVYKAFRLLQAFSVQTLAQVNYLSSLFTAQLLLQVFKKLAAPRGAGANLIKFI